MPNNKQKKKQTKVAKRPVDLLFEQYAEFHQHPTNKWIQSIALPFVTFGITGLIWFLPFPHLGFLGQYNGFVNWFTIVMAIVVYYYLRLAPTLSYAMLFSFGIFSFFIVQLEYWEKAGGPAPWLICSLVFVLGCIGQFIGYTIEGKKSSFLAKLRFLLIGPIWLWHFVFNKFRIPY